MADRKIFESIKLFAGEGGVTAPKGYEANGISCGIKLNGKKDLGVIYSKEPCNASAVFTTNRVKAAPIKVSKSNIKNPIHAIICNSGNANACTGREGLSNTKKMVKLLSEEFELPANSILAASTGIIGIPLPMQAVEYGISKLRRKLKAENNVRNVAEAILTTDTRTKMIKATCKIGGKTITIGGIAKGSGMINPNMATMLAFLTTDANISSKMMQKALRSATKSTFNKINIDGQMSTNDTVFLLSNNSQTNTLISRTGNNYSVFEEGLTRVCDYLAQEILNDGEGITKVIKITVKKAAKKDDADRIARSVADSPLVKTAFYGQSANWGRIIQAIGASGVQVYPDRINIVCNGELLCEKGLSTGISMMEGKKLLNKRNIDVEIDLGIGSASDFLYTADLTYDYVKINSKYS